MASITTLYAFAAAFVCAILSAWGVGGGTLLILVMTFFLDVEQQTAQGINLLFFLPTAATALCTHWRKGHLHAPTLRTAIPWAMGCAVLGALLALWLDTVWLRRLFGVYLLWAGFTMLCSKDKQSQKEES